MADIRGLPATQIASMGRFVAAVSGGGLTAGRRYWPLALGVDCQPVPPVVYVLVADDAGAIRSFPASAFTFTVDNLQP